LQTLMKHVVWVGLVMATVGCGGEPEDRISLVTAAGTVTVDGEARGDIKLTFSPVKTGATDIRPPIGATVGADGKFSITTYEPGDGAAPGQYNVTMTAGSGTAAADPSVDPAAMMAAMSGGGAGGTTAPFSIAIPKDGATDLKVELVSQKAAPAKNGGGLMLGQ